MGAPKKIPMYFEPYYEDSPRGAPSLLETVSYVYGHAGPLSSAAACYCTHVHPTLKCFFCSVSVFLNKKGFLK